MKKFFPVGSLSANAVTTTAHFPLPSGGPHIRIARETSSARVFIAFGAGAATATVSSMELVSGVVEELELPSSTYTYFAIICDTGTCYVNVSCGPRFDNS